MRRDLFKWSFESNTLSPYLDSPASEVAGQFSPDGNFVTYLSHESGPTEAWIARFPSPSEKRRIATHAGPVSWRADGREILIATAAGELAAIPVTITGDRVVTGPPTVLVRRLDDRRDVADFLRSPSNNATDYISFGRLALVR